MKRLLVSSHVAFVILLATSFAFAAPSFRDRMQARKLGATAKQLARQGKHEKAAKKYAQADKLVPAPSYKLELARVLLELEDYVQSSEVLEECMDQTGIQQWGEKSAQKKCIELASEVDDKMPRLAVVVIEPSSEDVIIQIDDEDYDPSEGEIGYNPGKFKITVRKPTDAYKATFRSEIDGSVQYFGVLAPTNATNESGIVLTLHGAGVQARGQVACYAPKKDLWIIAPTNRRPFGFDWQDWGRADAYEVLAEAEKRAHGPGNRTIPAAC